MTGRAKELVEVIQSAEKELEQIRKNCKHESTFEGMYSWRVGALTNALICNDCGALVKTLDTPIKL